MTAVAFDLTAMVHRAYHGGAPRAGRLAVTWALAILMELEPSHAAFAVDRPGLTFRHRLLPTYKGSREKKREEDPKRLEEKARIRAQQLEAEDILTDEHGLRIIGLAGLEADDLIGSFVRAAREADERVVVVANDKDLTQLIEERVTLREFPSGTVVDADTVRERFGVEPSQMTDYLALVGDTSDDVPGVRLIGEKSAPALLREYGSIEEIFATSPKALSKMAQRVVSSGREHVDLMRRLIALKTDSPIDLGEFVVDMGRVRGDESAGEDW